MNVFICIELNKDFWKIPTISLIKLAEFSFLNVTALLRPCFCIFSKGWQFDLFVHWCYCTVPCLNFFCGFFLDFSHFFKVSTAFIFFKNINPSHFMNLSCNLQNLDFYCLFYYCKFSPLIYSCMSNSLISLSSWFCWFHFKFL